MALRKCFFIHLHRLAVNKSTTHLKTDVEVEEANGSLFSKFILFLYPSHLNDTQALRLSWQGLHAQRLKAVLNIIQSPSVKTALRHNTTTSFATFVLPLL